MNRAEAELVLEQGEVISHENLEKSGIKDVRVSNDGYGTFVSYLNGNSTKSAVPYSSFFANRNQPIWEDGWFVK